MKKSKSNVSLFFIISLMIIFTLGCNEDEIDEIDEANAASISNIVPSHAYPGQIVTVHLKNFNETDQVELEFAPQEEAEIQSVNNNEVQVKVPFKATTGKVTLRYGPDNETFVFPEDFTVDQLPYEKLRIKGEGNEESGSAVYLAEDYTLLGARGKGAVYFFRETEQGWVQQEEILPSNKIDDFGSSIAVSGNYAVIGCGHNNHAFIFEKRDDTWIERAKLFEGEGKLFGVAVSIFEDQVAVGAASENAVYFYGKETNGQWTFKNKLAGNSGEAFGSSVSVYQDQLVVGASSNQEYATGAGAAYIYENQDNQWVLQQKILGESEGGMFGNKVIIRPDQAFVSAFYSNNQGEVFVYQKEGASWQFNMKMSPDRNDNSYGFGNDLAINGQYLAVGDYVKNSLYLYQNKNNDWELIDKITPPDKDEKDLFGKSVSIWGEQMLVGAMGDNDVGNTSGSAYLIDLN